MVKEYDLLKDDVGENKRRLAFSMRHANQLWQADTMFGPHVQRRQAKLIAFIDDASRVLCHGEFFLEENTDSMVQCLRAAFYKRGVPEQLLVDNGSIYCSQEITLICARVGCILRHTAVRDAAAKGKIERFFRRVRDQFLVRKLDLSSLEELNKQFTHWVERDYMLRCVGFALSVATNRGWFRSLNTPRAKTDWHTPHLRRLKSLEADNTGSVMPQLEFDSTPSKLVDNVACLA